MFGKHSRSLPLSYFNTKGSIKKYFYKKKSVVLLRYVEVEYYVRSFDWLVCNDQSTDTQRWSKGHWQHFFYAELYGYHKKWTLNVASKRERNFCCIHKTRRKHIDSTNRYGYWKGIPILKKEQLQLK